MSCKRIVASVLKASVGLLLGLIVLAGCSGTTSSSSSPLASQPPSASTTTEGPSVASPSLGSFKAYADSTLRPALNDLSDAFNTWGEAFNSAAQSGATDAAKAAYAAAASKLKDSLAGVQAALDNAPRVECAGEALSSAGAFLSLVKGALDPLLSKSSIGLGELAAAGALLQEAAQEAPGVAETIRGACQ